MNETQPMNQTQPYAKIHDALGDLRQMIAQLEDRLWVALLPDNPESHVPAKQDPQEGLADVKSPSAQSIHSIHEQILEDTQLLRHIHDRLQVE